MELFYENNSTTEARVACRSPDHDQIATGTAWAGLCLIRLFAQWPFAIFGTFPSHAARSMSRCPLPDACCVLAATRPQSATPPRSERPR